MLWIEIQTGSFFSFSILEKSCHIPWLPSFLLKEICLFLKWLILILNLYFWCSAVLVPLLLYNLLYEFILFFKSVTWCLLTILEKSQPKSFYLLLLLHFLSLPDLDNPITCHKSLYHILMSFMLWFFSFFVLEFNTTLSSRSQNLSWVEFYLLLCLLNWVLNFSHCVFLFCSFHLKLYLLDYIKITVVNCASLCITYFFLGPASCGTW